MEKFQLGNTGADPLIRTENDRIPARFGHLNKIVDTINSTSNKFDVTFTGLEFRNIGTTPLVVIQSNKAVIVTSVAAIITEQTEAFYFSGGVIITTSASNIAQAFDNSILNVINANTIFSTDQAQEGLINQGNAYVLSKDGFDATTGDGFVRIIGTYYEIDL
jgi:hypothetical protein